VKYIQPHMRTLRADTRANEYVQEALEECSNDRNSLREVVDSMPGTRGKSSPPILAAGLETILRSAS
jgi:hypothetical protein